MANRNDCDVLVVGGGNVGSALALALRRQGLAVTLVEPHQPPGTDEAADNGNGGEAVDVGLRVSALGPGSRHFLHSLHAWPQSDRRGPTAYQQMQVEDASGRGQLTFHAHQHGLPALGWIVDNSHLQISLWRQARAQQVHLLSGVRVTQVQPRKQATQVHFDDGQSLRAALVVAADGARSPLREQLNIPVTLRDYHQRALVTVVSTRQANPGVAWQRFLPGGPLALLPVSAGRSSIVWSLPADEAGAYLELDDAAFCRELTRASAGRFGPVTACGPRAAFPLSMMLAGRYIHERVVLVGDAAHRTHPLAGQGLNIGLQDAAALAEIIADGAVLTAGNDVLQRQLRRYERWRRSDDELVIRGVDVIGRLLNDAGRRPAQGSSLRAAMAGMGLSLVDKVWPLKDGFLRWACGLMADAPAAFRNAGNDGGGGGSGGPRP